LVKPNLLSGLSAEAAATTHPAVVGAVLARLNDLGARTTISDSPAFGWVGKVAEGCGVAEVARRYGIEIVELERPVSVASVRPHIRKTVVVDRAILEADVVINLPKLKAHRQLGFTGAVKNLYGCMPGKRKAYFHMERGNRDMDFARLIASFAYTVAPQLHLADAVVTMERDGPMGGDPRLLGALVAGTDAAAVDAVLAGLIDPPEENRLLLRACRELRLGSPDLADIEVRGEAPAFLTVNDFVHPLLVGVRFSPGRLARSVWRNYKLTRLSP
jgi:uncharacterized protein (DUF362 family)